MFFSSNAISCNSTINLPSFSLTIYFVVVYFRFVVSFEDSQYEVVPLTAEKVLEFIEQAYPNPITPEDLARSVEIFNEFAMKHILIN